MINLYLIFFFNLVTYYVIKIEEYTIYYQILTQIMMLLLKPM